PGPELAVLVGDPEAWGKGVAREAERQACIQAFEAHGAHRIHAEIPATNRAAQKVVTHLGFVREGVMRRAIRREDETVDNEVWGLLPEEFTGWGEGQSLSPTAGPRRRPTTSSARAPSTTPRSTP